MKVKNLLLILLTLLLLIKISLQQIIIPFGSTADSKGKEKNEEEEKPIVETKEIKDNQGNNIKITRITYNRTKNLNGYSAGITPFQIMRIFDERVNSIFDDFIRQSVGIKLLLNGLSKIDEEEEEYEYEFDDDYKGNITSKNRTSKDDFDIDKELDFDDDEEEDENIKDNNINITVKGGNNTISRRRISRHSKIGKNNTRLGKLKANIENIKGRIKKRKKLSRRQLIFSRVCKYIFYSIVLFTIYILVKKLLEFFEIIDPEGATEVKIENDEMANLKKTSGNKIS